MIAGHSFELIGCDAMHNAEKFARFPCETHTTDCRIEVTTQEAIASPQEEHMAQVGDWRCYPYGGGKRFLNRSRTMMIETDNAFTRVHLTFSVAMPQLPIVLYLQVQHMMCIYLLFHGGSLIHSAGLSLAGAGVLLCGRSGVGKSTMAGLLQALEPRVTVLSEDMPALMHEDHGFTVYGSPLCGDDRQCENACAPLDRVVLLRQAANNRLITPSDDEAVYELLTVVPRAVYATDVATAATDLVVEIARRIPIVIFENNGTQEAAQMLLSYLRTEPREQR